MIQFIYKASYLVLYLSMSPATLYFEIQSR